MISYRQHVVSLLAVFLALAVGIVLGGGPLSELGRADTAANASGAKRPAQERAAAYGDQFATAAGPTLYDGRLQSHPVAIVTLPGADGGVAAALGEQVAAAGGEVAGTYAVQPALVDPGQKSLVDTLGAQLATQLGEDVAGPPASTYVRIGQLLGLALSPDGAEAADVRAVRESLAGAELVGSPKSPTDAALVLVVLGERTDPAILSGVTSGLSGRVPVVVAGASAAASGDGDLVALRDDEAAEAVATVDGVETALGQVTATLALIRSTQTPGGSFGASSSDGAVPLT